MSSQPVLYSTNPALKLLIQREYRGDLHYVWCSEFFDSRAAPSFSLATLIGRSSNPADIYKELTQDVSPAFDRHSAKITQIKGSLTALASEWFRDGAISEMARDEIIYLLNHAGPHEWRPLLYVIPRTAVASRMKEVPPAQRSGFGREWIVEDLAPGEFDVIEFRS
jgi:hypothetical protein